MAKLYPPLIGGTIPAFYTESGTTNIVVPFSMNRAVSSDEVAGFALKIKYVDGDLIDIILLRNESHDIGSSFTLSFDVTQLVTNGVLKVGQYYKIQIAYIDEDQVIGYYSSIGVIKFTTLPTLFIDGISETEINNHQYHYIGVYQQNRNNNQDSTEKVYSSRFILKDSNNNIIKDTGYILHNTSEDDKSYESREIFFYGKDLKENVTYYLTYSVKTMNGLEYSSPQYRIIQSQFLSTETDGISLSADLNYENGYIQLGLNTDKLIISGSFLISRACSKDDYAWMEIKRFSAESLDPKEWNLKDCTIEQGYTYKYSLQQYNQYNIYSGRVISKEIYADFEHAYLFDGQQQFKISYDPKITNFKSNLLENKIDTIGSKYPFILRNGNVNYKSFDIQGLISLRSDEEHLFSNLSFNDDNYNIPSDLTSNNITVERKFKMEVLDWLNNGEPKLFRSPTEGNFIVRLLNVSLTPNDKLGRMIHSFKATAYEITTYNDENLQNLNIINSTENLTTLMKWSTIDLKALYKKIKEKNPQVLESNDFYPVIDNIKIFSLKMQNFQPGTIVSINGNQIMIGATGAYIIDDLNGISSIIKVKLQDFSGDGYDLPIITYSYESKFSSLFGFISEIQEQEMPLKQFLGTFKDRNTNLLTALTDKRSALMNLSVVRFKKKDVYQIFIDPRNFPVEENSFNDRLNSNLDEVTFYIDNKPINRKLLSRTAIYEIKYMRSEYRYHQNNPNDPYNNEGYYVDKESERFEPNTGYFLNYERIEEESDDGTVISKKDWRIIRDINPFNIILNKESIDLREKNNYYEISDPSIIKSIKINSGVIAELSYIFQINSYDFGAELENTEVLENAIDEYENIQQNKLIYGSNNKNYYLNRIKESTGMSEEDIVNFLDYVDNQLLINEQIYNNVIIKLDAVINEYNERNGII